MLHLLLGKQATPGNGAFSLTGQPSPAARRARWAPSPTAPRRHDGREPGPPRHTEERWGCRAGPSPKVGSHLTQMMRDLEDGKLRWLWVQADQPVPVDRQRQPLAEAARKLDAFIVVSDVYPTLSSKVADLILPSAMMYEKWGGYGNSERRTQLWRQVVLPPGEARSDLWQIMEFAKRFTLASLGRAAGARPGGGGFEKGKLPSLLGAAAALGHTPATSLTRCSSPPGPTGP